MEIVDILNNRSSNVEFADSPRSFSLTGTIKSTFLAPSMPSTSTSQKRKLEEEGAASDPKKAKSGSSQANERDTFAIIVEEKLAIWLRQAGGADIRSTEWDHVDTKDAFAKHQEMRKRRKVILAANKK